MLHKFKFFIRSFFKNFEMKKKNWNWKKKKFEKKKNWKKKSPKKPVVKPFYNSLDPVDLPSSSSSSSSGK